MKQKITLITSFFDSPYHKNRAPYNEQLFLKLKNVFDISIIRPIAWTDIMRSDLKIAKKEYCKNSWHGVPIAYPTYYFPPRISIKFNGLFYFLSIFKTFRSENRIPDIFYTTWTYPDAYAAMLIARQCNRKYVLRVHGSDINDLAFRKNIRHKTIKVLENAVAIFSPSQALKQKIISLGIDESKIHLIYSGVDKERFYIEDRIGCEDTLGLNHQIKRVLYIGNFLKEKGVLDLLYASKLLIKDLPHVEVCLIGKGKDEGIAREYINSQNLHDNVKIIGPVSHDELHSWINASDCLALPSYSEGVPNVILEALACKKNIVSTNVGGIPEIIKDQEKYLINPGDISALKDALLGALTDKDYKTESAINIESYSEISERISKIISQFIL